MKYLWSGPPFLFYKTNLHAFHPVSSQDLSLTYLSTPAHSVCAIECPGGQGGNPCQKMDFQKLLPGAINLPGVFAIILGTFW